MRLLRAHTEVRRALAHRKRALTHGAQQSRNAAIDSTTDQMCVEAAFAVMRALRVRTVACGELHGSLLMRTVCRASGVYSERSPLSLVHIHPRYRGTPPSCRHLLIFHLWNILCDHVGHGIYQRVSRLVGDPHGRAARRCRCRGAVTPGAWTHITLPPHVRDHGVAACSPARVARAEWRAPPAGLFFLPPPPPGGRSV